MTDSEETFANHLGEDLDRVLGLGVMIEAFAIQDEPARATATVILLLNGRAERLEAWARDTDELRRLIVKRAAELWGIDAFEGLSGPIVRS